MRRLRRPSLPKDDSPACSAEACAFRDEHEAFREAGATVIGVSSDGTAHRSALRAERGGRCPPYEDRTAAPKRRPL